MASTRLSAGKAVWNQGGTREDNTVISILVLQERKAANTKKKKIQSWMGMTYGVPHIGGLLALLS